MRGKSLSDRAPSCYFVHEGLTSYTHISDQHSTHGTQIIVSTERDATFTLDGIAQEAFHADTRPTSPHRSVDRG